MFAGFAEWRIPNVDLKLGKTEGLSCKSEVSLLSAYSCRLDIAIRRREIKERVPCFGRQSGNIYRWQI